MTKQLKKQHKKLWDRAQHLSLRYGMGDMYVSEDMVMQAIDEARKLKKKINNDLKISRKVKL